LESSYVENKSILNSLHKLTQYCVNLFQGERHYKIATNVKALAMWQYSVFFLPGAAADKRYKSSLFILLPGIIRLLEQEVK